MIGGGATFFWVMWRLIFAPPDKNVRRQTAPNRIIIGAASGRPPQFMFSAGRFESRPVGRLLHAGAVDAAPAQRKILCEAACFGRCAARDHGKPLNRHAPGQRSLSVMEN